MFAPSSLLKPNVIPSFPVLLHIEAITKWAQFVPTTKINLGLAIYLPTNSVALECNSPALYLFGRERQSLAEVGNHIHSCPITFYRQFR